MACYNKVEREQTKQGSKKNIIFYCYKKNCMVDGEDCERCKEN